VQPNRHFSDDFVHKKIILKQIFAALVIAAVEMKCFILRPELVHTKESILKTKILLSTVVFALFAVGCGDPAPGPDGGTGGGKAGGGSAAGGSAAGGSTAGGSAAGGSAAGGSAAGGSAAGGSAAGGSAGGGTAAPGTIVAVASANPSFSTLVAAVQKAGLVAALSDTTKKYTVFAPTNDAFAALLTAVGATSLNDLTADQLKPILLYHVLGMEVNGTAATAAAMSNSVLTTLGGKAKLAFTNSKIRIDNRANVAMADVAASNGVIHVIDAVLLPSVTDIVTTDSRFTSLTAAVGLADTATPSPNLATTLDDDSSATGFTVFAPTDAAFTALVTALAADANTGITALTSFRPDQVIPVLTYHVISGKVKAAAITSGKAASLGGQVDLVKSAAGVTVDGTAVTVADILASNGVIHVVGSVLLPSITDVVTTSAAMSSLKGLVVAADGVAASMPKVGAALDGTTKFTLFAPTNAAIAALPTAPSGQALTNVLLYHAVPTMTIYAAQALALTAPLNLTTALAGKTLIATAEGAVGAKTVNLADSTATKAKVTAQFNYFTSNGVIHLVDKVLIPAP
jgi:transforming growth factor-beta-induced protein